MGEPRVLLNVSDAEGSTTGRGRGRGRGRAQGGRFGIGRGQSNKDKVCFYCGKVGHLVDACYRKHGYPPRTINNCLTDEDVDDRVA